MSNEAKVGAFALGGLAMLTGALMALGDIRFGSDDNIILYAGFKQVLGLESQADVRLSGVPVGKVESIVNDGGGVVVTLKVDQEAKIPDNSTATVLSVGVMGDKFVNITPGKDNGIYLKNGDHIQVTEEADMNKMFEGLDKILVKVNDLLTAVEGVVGNETFQKSVIEMSENMKDASSHMNGLMSSLEKMAKENENNVSQMAGQLNTILANVDKSMQAVEHMTANIDSFAGDEKTVQDLRDTLENISAATLSIASVARNVEAFTSDPALQNDLLETISNAKTLTKRADSILGKVDGASDSFQQLTFTPSVELLYGDADFDTNLNLDVKLRDTLLSFGVEDIGSTSRLNAQIGKSFDSMEARAGLINGKVGFGVDSSFDRWKFSAEAYDLNNLTLRLKSQYQIAESTYLLAQWHDVNHRGRAAYFGLKQEF